MTSSNPTIGTKVGRARRRLGQLWQVPTFLVGLLALIGAAVSAPWRHGPDWHQLDALLVSLRKGVAEPDTVAESLVISADDALVRVARFPSRTAETQFLAGSAYFRMAQQKPALGKEFWPRAVKLLEKAQAQIQSVPEADRPSLQYRLGHSLYQQGKDLPRSLDLMSQSVDKGADQPLQGYELLKLAYMKLPAPNLEAAIAASQRVLDLTPEDNLEALSTARIAHAELLIRNKMPQDALKQLAQIGLKTSRPVRVQARLLQARCSEAEGLWEQAAKTWQDLLKDENHVEGGKARIYFRIGWCYRETAPPKNAETIAAWTEALQLGGPAGVAAGMYLGDLRLSQGGDSQARKALEDWKQAARSLSVGQKFVNPYIELKDVQNIFNHALEYFQKEQDPQKAQEITELCRKIGWSPHQKVARTQKEIALQMKKKQAENRGVTIEEVTAQFRRAAELYVQASQTGTSAERAEALWEAAQCYLSAKENKRCIDTLRQYVILDSNERRLAEGWCLLGDLYREQGQQGESHDAYAKCRQIPGTPFRTRALYWLAVEEIDKKNYSQAQSILEQILKNVSNDEWDRLSQEKALFKLGPLLMITRDHPNAMVYLKECIRLHPDNPNVILVREQLGECYRKLADREAKKEKEIEDQIQGALPAERRQQLEDTLRHHRRTKFIWLAEAVKTYQSLSDELESRGKDRPLNKIEQQISRRALFGIGECHLDSEEYHEALRVFRRLQLNHRSTVEGFYACLRISNLAEVFKEPELQAKQFREMAKDSLQLVEEDLKAMPETHEIFRLPGVYTKPQWLRWLDDMRTKLDAPPKTERPGLFK